MHELRTPTILFYLLALLIGGTPLADESQAPSLEGGMTVTAQVVRDGRVTNEIQGSLDLVGLLPLGPGHVTFYVAGGTALVDATIAALIGEVDADAGTAVDEQDRGRLQVSELSTPSLWALRP